MNRLHIITISIMVIIIIPIIQISCDSDNPPPKPSINLRGEYNGYYLYIINDTLSQAIKFNFSASTYSMNIDTASSYYSDFCICESYGNYMMDGSLILWQDSALPFTSLCISCNDSTYNPRGELIPEILAGDTLKLEQQLGDTIKIIKLIYFNTK